jgi:hypothetical protein
MFDGAVVPSFKRLLFYMKSVGSAPANRLAAMTAETSWE